MTSSSEVALAIDIFGTGMLGLRCQIAFVAFFVLGMLLYNKRYSFISVFAQTWVLSAAIGIALAGVFLYIVVALGYLSDDVSVWGLIVGAALRGFGLSAISLAWNELLVDYTPRSIHASIVSPVSLLIAALFCVALWVASLYLPSAATICLLGVMTALAGILLFPAKRRTMMQDVQHVCNEEKADMPRSTIFIIGAFGLSCGCFWATLYSFQEVNLPLEVCLSFLAASIFLIIGMKTFIVRKELEFGFALRWMLLLCMAGLLLVPVFASVSSSVAVVVLALGWAVQIMMLGFMSVQIPSKLPVSFSSVCALGGTSYGIGAVLGAVFGALTISLMGASAYAYSVIAAVCCLVLAVAMLYFPGRKDDASVMGLHAHTEGESRSDRFARRSAEVAKKWDLAPREQAVMYLMALGKNRSQIASELCISEETVKTHGKHIYKKLGVHSLRELVSLIDTGVV